jgi:Winged helix DNA-binding domain
VLADVARGGHADRETEIQARRFAAQLLSGPPARSAVEVAGRLVAIQAQDPRAARLAVRARTSGLTATDVDRALTQDRSLVLTWLNRGTLHLIRSEDYWWLHKLTAKEQFQVGCYRILARLGVSPERADKGVEVAGRALANDGPLTRGQLAERFTAAGLATDDGAALHMLMLASLRGLAVRGPMIGAQHAYAGVRDWLGAPSSSLARDSFDRDAALAELARRYLAGHGPAGDRDLAKWSGLPLGEARRGLRSIGGELGDRSDGLAELASARQFEADMPPPRLLGGFDAMLLGWASREPIIGSQPEIVTANGLFRPIALADGKAAAIWSYSAGEVTLDRFRPLSPETEAALAAEAIDVRRFLAGSAAAGQDTDEAA